MDSINVRRTTNLPSSWISSIRYRRTPDGTTYVAVFLRSGSALLYGGADSPIPSYLPGLLCAGTPRKGEEDAAVYHSVGRAYNRLLKGKYQYQLIEDAKQVNELKEIMS